MTRLTFDVVSAMTTSNKNFFDCTSLITRLAVNPIERIEYTPKNESIN